MKVLVGCLKHDTGKFSSGLGHHRLLLAATDCVWCTVVGNNVVEDIFLENEGVFVLLDLLKVRVAERMVKECSVEMGKWSERGVKWGISSTGVCEVVEAYKDLVQVLTYLVLSKFMKMVITSQ